MPEAEDVILHAVDRAATAVRSLWLRHCPPGEAPGAPLAEAGRRLTFLLQACFGRDWPLTPSDPSPPPTWLAKRLGSPTPWELLPAAEAFTDGVQIFLPRRLHRFEAEARDHDLLRLMALMLGARLARGTVDACPSQPLARDLFWAADGAMVETFLAAELPRLAGHIAAARRLALASRPRLEHLSPRERAVESAVRCVLEASSGGMAAVLPDLPAAPASPADLARWAIRAAEAPPFHGPSVYRGVASVPHWGRPRPDLLGASRAQGGRPAQTGNRQSPGRSQQLPRRVEPRDANEDEGEERQGPFLIPSNDPQQSVEDPAGLRRPSDQGEEPDLEALAEELARLGRAPRVRSDAAVRDILEPEGVRRRQAVLPAAQDRLAAVGIAYPEWDHRTGAYRQSYCLVREVAAPTGDAAWPAHLLSEHQALIRAVRRRFEALRPKREYYARQLDGDDIDLNAYVDDFAARHASHPPSDRLYLAHRPRRRDVSVAFLIDASGSTDAWVGGGRRVLDLEKEAALVFCEALEALGDRYAVYAFSGRGAHDVVVSRVKGFGEDYGEAVRGRIAGLAGEAFTRLGAPVRHLTALLMQQRTRQRLLFLLSDGKPNDEDEYEGLYGIEDTRQAVAEARLQGTNPFCVTVDRQHSSYLPQMFGPHGYIILWDVIQLPQRLPEIYRRLTAVPR